MRSRHKDGKGILHFLWETAEGQKRYVFLMTAIQIALGTAAVLQAGAVRSVIDSAVAGSRNSFVQAALYFTVLIIAQLLLRAIIRPLREYTKATIENRFKTRLFRTILYDDFSYVTDVHSGEWMNRLTSDTTVVANNMTEIIPDAIGTIVRMVGALVYMIILFPEIAAFLIPAAIVVGLIALFFRNRLKVLHREIQQADGSLRVYLTERIQNILIVRSFQKEESSLQGAQDKMNLHRNARIKRSKTSNLLQFGYGVFFQGTYLVTALFCGYRILQGLMSYGTFTAVLHLIAQIQSPIANLSGYFPRYYAMLSSAERLQEAELHLPDRSAEAAIKESVYAYYKERFKGIILDDVSFTYQDEDKTLQVLSHFNFKINAGEYIALTGPSGCGKSTLLKLLMGLYPTKEGHIYIEEQDRSIPLTLEHRSLYAYVPQGNQLMSGTIREVVAFGDLEGMKQEEALWNALRVACAEEFVRNLPEQLDTMLGEKGTGLSEGQMQRIAVARAVFSAHPILLLDEATSSLDEATEQILLNNLKNMTDRTVIIVTHRPGALNICDQQIHMEDTMLQGESVNDRRKDIK